jgi:peroxiredoxin
MSNKTILILLLLAGGAYYYWSQIYHPGLVSEGESVSGYHLLAENDSVPHFKLSDTRGFTLDFTDLTNQNKLIAINFWDSTCSFCTRELDHLEALYQQYKEQGFTVIGINEEENSSTAMSYCKNNPKSFPISMDPQHKMILHFGIRMVPSTVFINANGKIEAIVRGAEPEKLKKIVAKYL